MDTTRGVVRGRWDLRLGLAWCWSCVVCVSLVCPVSLGCEIVGVDFTGVYERGRLSAAVQDVGLPGLLVSGAAA